MRYVEIHRDIISPELRERVLSRDKYTCRYCGSKNSPFHLDHVYPVVKGGETSEQNLVTSCKKCNSKKHSSVGMWPKPIGHFDKKPEIEISILTVFLLTLGVASLALNVQDVIVSESLNRYTLLVGFIFCSLGLGRVATGR